MEWQSFAKREEPSKALTHRVAAIASQTYDDKQAHINTYP